MWWRFWEKRPSSVEVIEAIFSLLSEEELRIIQEGEDPGEGIKEFMLHMSKNIKPKYPVKKSVKKAKEIIDPFRRELYRARGYLFHKLLFTLFYC